MSNNDEGRSSTAGSANRDDSPRTPLTATQSQQPMLPPRHIVTDDNIGIENMVSNKIDSIKTGRSSIKCHDRLSIRQKGGRNPRLVGKKFHERDHFIRSVTSESGGKYFDRGLSSELCAGHEVVEGYGDREARRRYYLRMQKHDPVSSALVRTIAEEEQNNFTTKSMGNLTVKSDANSLTQRTNFTNIRPALEDSMFGPSNQQDNIVATTNFIDTNVLDTNFVDANNIGGSSVGSSSTTVLPSSGDDIHYHNGEGHQPNTTMVKIVEGQPLEVLDVDQIHTDLTHGGTSPTHSKPDLGFFFSGFSMSKPSFRQSIAPRMTRPKKPISIWRVDHLDSKKWDDRMRLSGSSIGSPKGFHHLEDDKPSSRLLDDPSSIPLFARSTEISCLEWRNLSFEAGNQTILKNCYGALYPGEVCALIGPSGAGKSTLLNLLAGRQKWNSANLKTKGDIVYKGVKLTESQLKNGMSLIMQHEEILESQSVIEAITFNARLRNNSDHECRTMSLEEIQKMRARFPSLEDIGGNSTTPSSNIIPANTKYSDIETGIKLDTKLDTNETDNETDETENLLRNAAKNAANVDNSDIFENSISVLIDCTLKMLGLYHIKDTRVGSISGGQKKRVACALELIANPQVLFLDEPTSGLDSFSSLQLMENLKRIAKEQNTIICLTIHQPSQELFGQFDRIYCMRYGEIIFHGLNKPDFYLEMETVVTRHGDQPSSDYYSDSDGDSNQARGSNLSNGRPSSNAQDSQIMMPDHQRTSSTPSTMAGQITNSPGEIIMTNLPAGQNPREPNAKEDIVDLVDDFLYNHECLTVEGFVSRITNDPIPSGYSVCDWLLHLAQSLPEQEIQSIWRAAKRSYMRMISQQEYKQRVRVLREVVREAWTEGRNENLTSSGGFTYQSPDYKNLEKLEGRLVQKLTSVREQNLEKHTSSLNVGETGGGNDDPRQSNPRASLTFAPPRCNAECPLKPRTQPGFCLQTRMLTLREFQSTVRAPFSLIMRFATPMVQVGFYAIVFMDVGRQLRQGVMRDGNNPSELVPLREPIDFGNKIRELSNSQATALFMAFTAGAQGVFLNIPAERKVFLREYIGSLYGTVAYLIAKTLIEVPIAAIQALVLAIIVWTGYGSQGGYGYLFLVFFLALTGGGAVGVAVSTLTEQAEVSLIVLAILTSTIPACFAGVFRAISQLPPFVQWIRHLIPLSHISNVMGYYELEVLVDVYEQPNDVIYVVDSKKISPDKIMTSVIDPKTGLPDYMEQKTGLEVLIQERDSFWKSNNISGDKLGYWISLSLIIGLIGRAMGILFLTINSRSIK